MSCVAAPDTTYDKITAVDRAIKQCMIIHPKETQVEKNMTNSFEHEVSERLSQHLHSIFILTLPSFCHWTQKQYWSTILSKVQLNSPLLMQWSILCRKPKKKFKDCHFLVQKYHIACIDCMYRYYTYKGNRMLSTFFLTISVYIEMQVHFFGTMLTQIAESFQLEEEVVDLPKPIVQWFESNLDNFDLSDAGLEYPALYLLRTLPLC